MQRRIEINERLPLLQSLPLSVQHLFAMFGATVLVPFLTGLDVGVALFASGIGTLIFMLITKGKVPAYLGSSFAFIAPIQAATAAYGINAALGGAIVAGFVYLIVGTIIKLIGTDWLNKVLPPVVVGSVIIVIGLGLAPVAVGMAGLKPEPGVAIDPNTVMVSIFTLLVTLLGTRFFRGFLAVIPVLIGIISGYILALALGMVDFTEVMKASWLAVPKFTAPTFNLSAILIIAPVAVVTLAEHIGDVLVLGNIAGKNFAKEPGLHRTMWGDGLATSIAALFGGPPNTTYGENVGVMAITKVFSVWVIGGAAIMAIALSFIQKFGMLIKTIPTPVMGGVSMLLFGVIASSGVRVLIQNKVDFDEKRNLAIASVILVTGIGGASLSFGNFAIQGMALATLIGIVLNLILPVSGTEEKKAVKDF